LYSEQTDNFFSVRLLAEEPRHQWKSAVEGGRWWEYVVFLPSPEKANEYTTHQGLDHIL
jgi:hypothetical protein